MCKKMFKPNCRVLSTDVYSMSVARGKLSDCKLHSVILFLYLGGVPTREIHRQLIACEVRGRECAQNLEFAEMYKN